MRRRGPCESGTIVSKPLEGIRVADFSWFGAGPIAARTLADFGADVIRIESEARIDGLRSTQPVPPGKEGLNVSGYFNNFNAAKRSLLLNMGHERAREVAQRLIERSDVFLANYTPRVIENWGLTYDVLREWNPRIIAAYQPMQGFSGPHRDFLGFGAVLTPVTGLSYLTGFPHRPPFGLGTNYPDYAINPGHTVIAILAALRYRERTGKGQMIELAQLESVAAVIGPALMDYANNAQMPERTGNRSAWMTPHGVFRCLDEPRDYTPTPLQGPNRERWIALACRHDADWDGLCRVAAGAPFATDPRFETILGRKEHEDALEAAISAWTGARKAVDLMRELQAAGVPAGVVHDAQDMLEHDEHIRARGFYRYLDHPETGRAAYDGPVVRLHGTPGELDRWAPLFGEHTFEVAMEVCGYDADAIAELVAAGVLQ